MAECSRAMASRGSDVAPAAVPRLRESLLRFRKNNHERSGWSRARARRAAGEGRREGAAASESRRSRRLPGHQGHDGALAPAAHRGSRALERLQPEELRRERMMAVTKPLHELSIAEAGRALRAGTVSSLALTQHALARIASLDPLLHAFVLVTKERALADAERA